MVGIGIVGIGGWGKNHVRVLATLKSEGIIDYVGIADISDELLKKMKKMFSIDYATKDLRDLAENDSIDGIIIATPTPLHYEHAKIVLEHDKHVLVEKPLTSSINEAIELMHLAKEKRKIITVGFLLRFSPAILYARDAIKRGVLGNIISISSKRTSLWPNRKLDVEIIRDLAIHDIDLVRFLTDTKPKSVFAIGGSKVHGIIDHSAILFGYEKTDATKLPVLIEASWVTPFKIRRLEITGDKGSAVIELLQHKITIAHENEILTPILKPREPLFEEDKNFALSIAGKEKPLVTVEDGIIALKACEAALESIKLGKLINIDYDKLS